MGVSGELVDFGAFYERTYSRAFGIAYGMTGEHGLAEDVTQDAFVAAFRRRASFRGDGPVEAWLYRIVVNAGISALRRQRVRFITPLDPADPAPAPDDTETSALDTVALSDGLHRLDARSRSAVVLRYWLDLDYATIASILGLNPGHVGAILSRSRDRLATFIDASATHARERQPALQGASRHG